MLVLCYHALSDRWPAALSTTPERFEQQLQHLLGRGYEPATFTSAVKDPPASRTLAVTFDDAYRSVLELAYPIMDRLGIPGRCSRPRIGSAATSRWPGTGSTNGSAASTSTSSSA